MNIEEMEAKLKALEDQVKAQEKKVTTLEDIEAIKRLQKAYNYYVEHMLGQEIIDCFYILKSGQFLLLCLYLVFQSL